jgi:hypothetical protein
VTRGLTAAANEGDEEVVDLEKVEELGAVCEFLIGGEALFAPQPTTCAHEYLPALEGIVLRRPRFHEARFVGEHHQLRAIAGVELRHDPADVGLGGCGTDHEVLGDLGVR